MPLKTHPYHKIKDGPVAASDVDDTIFMWNVPEDYEGPLVTVDFNGYKEIGIPNTPMIEFIKKFKRRGHSILVWSRAGSDWAEAVVNAVGLTDYVDVILPKLTHFFDDVRDPADKLGNWTYIDPDGFAYHMNGGSVVKRHLSEKKGDIK